MALAISLMLTGFMSQMITPPFAAGGSLVPFQGLKPIKKGGKP
jgi:hypothetical protein